MTLKQPEEVREVRELVMDEGKGGKGGETRDGGVHPDEISTADGDCKMKREREKETEKSSQKEDVDISIKGQYAMRATHQHQRIFHPRRRLFGPGQELLPCVVLKSEYCCLMFAKAGSNSIAGDPRAEKLPGTPQFRKVTNVIGAGGDQEPS